MGWGWEAHATHVVPWWWWWCCCYCFVSHKILHPCRQRRTRGKTDEIGTIDTIDTLDKLTNRKANRTQHNTSTRIRTTTSTRTTTRIEKERCQNKTTRTRVAAACLGFATERRQKATKNYCCTLFCHQRCGTCMGLGCLLLSLSPSHSPLATKWKRPAKKEPARWKYNWSPIT